MGTREFETYYESVYGTARWQLLLPSLLAPSHKFARPNAFANEHTNLLAEYVMDCASLFPAYALDVIPGLRVLDMCAAPGGKSLILAECLNGDGELVVAEPSKARRERLKSVLRQYIPEEKRGNLTVSGLPGEVWGRRSPQGFDRILLDAPCSGERHLLQDSEEMKTWTQARVRRNAARQVALICSAWDALATGGRLVYSTCSINPIENDGVIKTLLKKRDDVYVVDPHESFSSVSPILKQHCGGGNPEGIASAAEIWPGERTETGWIILPDSRNLGWGPIFFAICLKTRTP